jgi:alanine racemase
MNPLIGVNDCLLIDDTYNANTQSTLGALEWMSAIREEQGRVIFVMGNMDGGNRNGYRKVGQRAAHVADVLITQGMDAAQSARAALDQGMDQRHVHVTYSMQDTVNLLEQGYQISAEDILLLKGSMSSHLEDVARALLKDPADSIQLPRQGEQAATARFEPLGPSWVEIDTDAIAGNVQKLKDMVGEDVTLMAVVKSNGYGHGAVRIARTALTNGADYLGVSTMQEALELREAGVDAPILTMNYTPTYLVRHAIQHDIALTLYDLGIARAYDRIARELNGSLRVHIKVDTGMGRLGAMPDETVTLFRHLIALRNLDVEGIYTHFSMADEDPEYTESQIDIFKEVYRPLQATTGIKFKYIHAANSAATLTTPEGYFSMVRCGLAVYGMHPSAGVQLPEGFRPALTWKTVISQVKTLPPGHPVGYGNSYITFGEERIAIIPVGYGDGFRRGPKNWGQVLVHGERVFVLGRVSMEKTALRIPDDMEVAIGDEVVLLGSQGDDTITAEEVAERLGTINYEVTCGILPRAPRL